jgi:Fe-S oxidoreductase
MRFAARPLRKLPTLEPRRQALETCVYCPKLCRSACPVSNAEPRETIIPWGKMSTAYFAARGDVALTESFAAPAWACTGCFACRDACDHKNDVAGTLLDARDAFMSQGLGPAPAKRTVARFGEHRERTRRAYEALSSKTESGTLVIGCTYARRLPDVARDALAVATRLFGPTTLEHECCGLPLQLAGDAKAFRAQSARFASRKVVAVDPGCALALRSAGADVTLLLTHVAERLNELRPGDGAVAPRWHDPCQLGRGLGVYDAPRAILTRILGRPPAEFPLSGSRAECSGGGGLLPLTMPKNSKAIARKRVEDHASSGGGEIVTACASSLLRFRAASARASDIMTWIARALP